MKKAPRPKLRRSNRIDVTRQEFNALPAALDQRATFMDETRRDLDIQFRRIADIQADVDEIKRTLKKLSIV